MAYMDYNKMFSCPRCRAIGTVYLVKMAGNSMVIKQKCPNHGARSFRVPYLQERYYIDLLRRGVFQCFKCGQEATEDQVKIKGPYTLLKCNCPTHGNKLPFQKIWSSVYSEISSKGHTTPQSAEAQPTQPQLGQPISSDENKFCSNCGTQIEGTGRFCGNCGSEID